MIFTLSSCAGSPASTQSPSAGAFEYAPDTVQVIRTDLVYSTVQSAVLVPRIIQKLAFEISGDLAHVYVKGGDFVRAGTVLAELDPAEHHQRIERSEIELQILEIRKQQRENDAAGAALTLADAREAHNTARARGLRDAIERTAITLKRAQLNVDLAEFTEAAFEMDYIRSHDAHEKLVNDLEHIELKAPTDGFILFDTDIEIEQSIRPVNVVFEFFSTEDFLLHINSREAIHLHGQENVRVMINDILYMTNAYIPVRGDDVWKAQIPQTQAFLEFNTTPRNLQPFETVSIGITIERRNALAIPRRSVRSIGGNTSVDVLDGDFIINVPVELGVRSGDLVEIKSGLSEDDIVIIN